MDIITQKFDEWTAGKGPKEASIAVFEHIRDIPYAIVPEFRDPAAGPAGLIKENKGSCQPKHYLIAQLFGKLDIPIKLVTYVFRWGDSEIKFPDNLKQLLDRMPVSYHLACKANLNGRWVLSDATYDPPLEKAGFPVTKKWDGENDAINAVTPLQEIIHESAEDRVRFEAEQRARYSPAEQAVYAEFIYKLNAWLETLRK